MLVLFKVFIKILKNDADIKATSLQDKLNLELINLENEKKKTLNVEAEIKKNEALKEQQNKVIANLRTMQLAYKSKYEEGNIL